MKKKLLILLLVVSTLVLALVGCAPKVALPTADYSAVYDREMPSMQLDSKGNFNILQVTDTHFVGGKDKHDKTTLENLNRILSEKDYDLVVLTGDIFDGHTKRAYDKPSAVTSVIKLFDDNAQKFTYISGNNDGEILGSDKDVVLQLLGSENFIFADNKIQGCGNFYISLNDSAGNEKHRLVMFDTSHRDKKGEYIAIGADQVEWYKTIAKECSDKNIKLSFFGHIPFDNIASVISEGTAVTGDDNLNGIEKFWDEMGNQNTALFGAIKSTSVCALIVSGHMHNVDVAKNYDGIIYKITRASGTSYALGESFPNGVCEITICTNATTLIDFYSFNTLTY